MFLFQKGSWNAAINRFYYACFYAARALAATVNRDSKSHLGLIAIFHEEFVKMPAARSRLLEAYGRLATSVTHPLFGYACTYRRLLELEGRLLGRHILGELPAYRPFRIR